MTDCDCYGYLSKGNPRLALWQTILDQQEPHIPLKHPLKVAHPTMGPVYEGDANRLTDDQRERLIKAVSEKFGLSRESIETDILQADNTFCVSVDGVSICAMHTTMMAD